jgi:low temperature requirement protein LtrA
VTEALIRPPRLRTDQPASASRLELFLDLAYVLVVLELADQFLREPTWHGAAVFAGLFATVWSSWVGFTLYANRFDTDDVVFRFGMPAARPTVGRYLVTIGVSAALWAVSLGVTGNAGFWWWGAAVLIGSAGPWLVGRTGGQVAPVHGEDLTERFGLLVIPGAG